MFKTAADFNGYWIKNLKNFQGHEGEPLFQCSVYKDNKKIGSFSEDSWGGPAMLSCEKQEDREALVDFAKKFEGKDAWDESYHTFIAKIAEEIDLIKHYKRVSKTNLILHPESYSRDKYRVVPFKNIEGRSWEKLREASEKRLGVKVTIVNDLLKNL